MRFVLALFFVQPFLLDVRRRRRCCCFRCLQKGVRCSLPLFLRSPPSLSACLSFSGCVCNSAVQVLCYIESDRYGNDLALLEEVVETYTFFPLNEICGGFFFGAFNIMLAIEDMPGMQSLYLKTQVSQTRPADGVAFVDCNLLSNCVARPIAHRTRTLRELSVLLASRRF